VVDHRVTEIDDSFDHARGRFLSDARHMDFDEEFRGQVVR
jgi:hypothetical protein